MKVDHVNVISTEFLEWLLSMNPLKSGTVKIKTTVVVMFWVHRRLWTQNSMGALLYKNYGYHTTFEWVRIFLACHVNGLSVVLTQNATFVHSLRLVVSCL